MNDAVLELTIELCRRASLTPDDAGCQLLLAERLAAAGFSIETLRFGAVDNLWAWHGRGGPMFALLGHTDVVPAGDPAAWQSPAFTPTLRDGLLYARGAADMKGSVAAMVLALADFVAADPDHPGVVGLLLTSDEEGVAEDGIRRVVDHFIATGRRIDYCLVGEPSSEAVLGDRIRCGRRGSLHGHLIVRGVQGHVAYPELALNPIHHALPALAELAARQWDQGNALFPPTRLQISNIHAGSGASNVIPAELRVDFNFRFGSASRAEDLMQGVDAILVAAHIDYRNPGVLSGAPFHPPARRLGSAGKDSGRAHCGIETRADTGGGTSDGRFVAPLGAEVVEIGPVNASIHKIDEHVAVRDLARLQAIYLDVLRRVLQAPA